MSCPSCQADTPPEATLCGRCGHSLTPTLEIRPGTILAERYDVLRPLGKGGMGTVFLAHDRLLDEPVALKVLRRDADQGDEAVQRFIQEIKLARAVSHRNVCRIHEYGEDRGVRYISMAYIEGVELRALLREGGALPALEAVDFAIGVAEGLHAIHEEGIVHRDLKPANIMVDKKGIVRVMDFGIAKASSAPGMTASGSLVGTPEYMSPEQIRGARLDRRSDIYSLGVVLYELLTGTVPFRGDTPVDTILKHLHDAPALDTLMLLHLPEQAKRIVAKALAKDPEERYATALEMARALEAVRHRLAAAPTLDHVVEATRELPGIRRAIERTVAAPTPRKPPPRRAGVWRAAALAIAGVAAAAFAMTRLMGPLEAPGMPSAPSVAVPTAPPPASTLAPSVQPSALPALPQPKPSPRAPRATLAPSPRAGTETPPPPTPEASANQQRASGLVAEADAALLAQDYERAMQLYDQALALEPANEGARRGRGLALEARVRSQLTPSPELPRGLLLVGGETTATSPEKRTEGSFDEDFEAPGKIDVKRATQDPTLPGRIEFVVEPERVLTGEPYTIRILLWNTGRTPIGIAELSITTVANNRKVSGSVPPVKRQVAPGEHALLWETKDHWPDNIQSWALEATVVTSRNETYRSTLKPQTGR